MMKSSRTIHSAAGLTVDHVCAHASMYYDDSCSIHVCVCAHGVSMCEYLLVRMCVCVCLCGALRHRARFAGTQNVNLRSFTICHRQSWDTRARVFGPHRTSPLPSPPHPSADRADRIAPNRVRATSRNGVRVCVCAKCANINKVFECIESNPERTSTNRAKWAEFGLWIRVCVCA